MDRSNSASSTPRENSPRARQGRVPALRASPNLQAENVLPMCPDRVVTHVLGRTRAAAPQCAEKSIRRDELPGACDRFGRSRVGVADQALQLIAAHRTQLHLDPLRLL